MFKNRSLMLKGFVFSSILMISSMFTCNAKVFALFMMLWLITAFWNMKLMFDSSRLKLEDFENHINQRVNEAKSNKKYFESGMYFMIFPAIICALMFVILSLGLLIIYG